MAKYLYLIKELSVSDDMTHFEKRSQIGLFRENGFLITYENKGNIYEGVFYDDNHAKFIKLKCVLIGKIPAELEEKTKISPKELLEAVTQAKLKKLQEIGKETKGEFLIWE